MRTEELIKENLNFFKTEIERIQHQYKYGAIDHITLTNKIVALQYYIEALEWVLEEDNY